MMMYTQSLDDYVSETHKVKDLTIDGKRSQCGGCCCNTPPLTDKEIKNIRYYVKANNIQPSYAPGLLLMAGNVYDNTCPFLDHSKDKEKCKIYSVRPHICKSFICSDTDLSRYANDSKYLEETRTHIRMRETFFPK